MVGKMLVHRAVNNHDAEGSQKAAAISEYCLGRKIA